MRIIPAIIAKNQKEFDDRLDKVKNNNLIHLDVMDGNFVKNKSLNFDLELPRKKYQVHLMTSNPKRWLEIIGNKAESIIFHIEAVKKPLELIKLIKKSKRKVGIAINPNTNVGNVISYLDKIDFVLVMTVNPGKYGSKFIKKAIGKIDEIKKTTKIKVGVDGGINDKTIKLVRNADFVVVGSYIQNSKDAKLAVERLSKPL